MSSLPTFRRVIAVCCCAQHPEFTAVPDHATKTTGQDGLTYFWWDCDCGSGVLAIERDGVLMTVAEVQFAFARRGVA